jgi:D-3-phosphoglycerate dehydrogenase
VIGTVGTLLGDARVNIADMDVGRVADEGTAVMLIATTTEVPVAVVDALRAAPGILSVIELAG